MKACLIMVAFMALINAGGCAPASADSASATRDIPIVTDSGQTEAADNVSAMCAANDEIQTDPLAAYLFLHAMARADAAIVSMFGGELAAYLKMDTDTGAIDEEITVRLDNGRWVSVTPVTNKAFHLGDRVRFVNEAGATRVEQVPGAMLHP